MKCLVPDCDCLLDAQESFCPPHLEAYLDYLEVADEAARAVQRTVIQSPSGRLLIEKGMAVQQAPGATPQPSFFSSAWTVKKLPELAPVSAKAAGSRPGATCGACRTETDESRYICSECSSKYVHRACMLYGIQASDTKKIESLWDKLREEESAKNLLNLLDEELPSAATHRAPFSVFSPAEAEDFRAAARLPKARGAVFQWIFGGMALAVVVALPVSLLWGGSPLDSFHSAVDNVRGQVSGESHAAGLPKDSAYVMRYYGSIAENLAYYDVNGNGYLDGIDFNLAERQVQRNILGAELVSYYKKHSPVTFEHNARNFDQGYRERLDYMIDFMLPRVNELCVQYGRSLSIREIVERLAKKAP